MKTVIKPGPGADKLKNLLKQTKNIKGKVGWFENEKYPETGTPVAYVATIHEFGDPTNKIPARPILRPTIDEHEKEWAQLAKQGAKALIAGNETGDTVMKKIVLKAAGDARETVSQLTSPPLKKSTVLARARRRGLKIKYSEAPTSLKKPLVDTILLLTSLVGIVEKK